MFRQCLSRRGFLVAALSAAGAGVQGWQDDERYGVSALASDSAFARIPAGDFVMGSATGPEDERPPHRVRISRAFEMSRFEITQSQWKSVMTDPHHARLRPEHQGEDVTDSPSQFKGASLPVDSVSWYDVQLFVARLNAFSEKYTYRLPTEAEWEYTCRAGQQESRDPPKAMAWFKEESGESTHPVGQALPNAWGLHDMLGNVAEWVQDWYKPDYYEGSARKDPQGPGAGSYRVFRGGSWLDAGTDARPSTRFFEFPISRLYNVGFRIVRMQR